MDPPTPTDSMSVEEGRFVVFSDLTCSVIGKRFFDRFTRNKRKGRDIESQHTKEHLILGGAHGCLRPGRLTFILGPSGAGKTTLLKILAGRKWLSYTIGKHFTLEQKTFYRPLTGSPEDVSESRACIHIGWVLNNGLLHGAGRDAVLVAQHATLIDTLTGNETLLFAARLKLPTLTKKDRIYAIENVAKQLGIQHALNTRNGNMSGGERKRLTIACELLTDPAVLLLDEPTSGLDSVSSMSVVRALLSVARGGRTVACVIHQPSSRLYSSADDVIVLASGRTVYSGTTADAPETMKRAGFNCPQYYNMADFLLEVSTGEHGGDLKILDRETKKFSIEMTKLMKNDVKERNGNDTALEAQALLRPNTPNNEGYAASTWNQLIALLGRCFIGLLRDVYLTKIRIICHFLVALLLGALYNGAGADAARVTSNTACLFFYLLFLFFSNAMPTIQAFPAEATVVLQEHLNKWYSLPAYCISKLIAEIPVQIICATVFFIPAWILTSQPLEVNRMLLAWCICILITILAQTFGLVVGAACGVKFGLFVVPAANIPMLMFSEFFIPYKEMPIYLQPFATISYFRYAFDAFIQCAYGFGREKLPCHEIFCFFKYPDQYLKHLGLNMKFSSDIYALVIWIVLLQFSLIVVLNLKVYNACR